ncbi:MAG: transposase [Rhodospirillales bacterium]|nr:transposase [Rhodospirillales bacterium]
MSLTDLNSVLPILVVIIGGIALLLIDLAIPKSNKVFTAYIAIVTMLVALVAVPSVDGAISGFSGMVASDGYARFLDALLLIIGIITTLLTLRYNEARGIMRGEFFPLTLFALSGMMLMGHATNLLTVFIAVELLSIPLYILCGFARPALNSEESALKYFLLGAFASGFLVYGIALIYGATGTTSLSGVASAITAGNSTAGLLLAGTALLLFLGQGLVEFFFDYARGQLGGAAGLEKGARATGALQRARSISNAVVLLRLLLAYCLGDRGLRSVAGWAVAQGIADISNPALLYRLQNSVEWLESLVAQALLKGAPKIGKGRLIRIIDGTTVPKAGTAARKSNGLWRIHAAFDLPSERFSAFELTDEKGGEQLDRIPPTKGEIRIADRAFMQADRLEKLLAAGADVVVRTGWKHARWLRDDGASLDIVALLESRKARRQGFIDQSISIGRNDGAPHNLRLVALRKSPQAAEAARAKARREAQRGQHTITKATLIADRVDRWIVTSLNAELSTQQRRTRSLSPCALARRLAFSA